MTSSPPLNLKLGETFGLTVAVEFVSGGSVDTGYDGSVNLALLGASAALAHSLGRPASRP